MTDAPKPLYIEESLWPLAVPIGVLSNMKANPRLHPEESIEAIKTSLKVFRQQKPVVVSSDNVVIAGNGTLQAAVALGWEYIAASKTTLTAKEAEAYAVADNRAADLSTFDFDIVRDIFKGLDDVLKTSAGFSKDEIDGLMGKALPEGVVVTDSGEVVVKKAKPNSPDEHWVGMPEFDQEDRQSFRRIIVHFESEDDVEKFFSLIGQSHTDKTRSIWYPPQEWHETEAKRYAAEEPESDREDDDEAQHTDEG
jgi:hypothetical protein